MAAILTERNFERFYRYEFIRVRMNEALSRAFRLWLCTDGGPSLSVAPSWMASLNWFYLKRGCSQSSVMSRRDSTGRAKFYSRSLVEWPPYKSRFSASRVPIFFQVFLVYPFGFFIFLLFSVSVRRTNI